VPDAAPGEGDAAITGAESPPAGGVPCYPHERERRGGMAHNGKTEVLEATRRALARAGYRMLEEDPPPTASSE